MRPGAERAGDEAVTESSDEAASGGIIEDIAALARQLAEIEPCKSASGPEALRALAARLDDMVAPPRTPAVVRVAVRPSLTVKRQRRS
jgi:hypothetical protein